MAGCNFIFILSYYFPQDPFYSISFYGATAMPGDGQAKSAFPGLQIRNLIGIRFWRTAPEENKPFAAVDIAPGVDGLNILPVFQAATGRKSVIHFYFLRAIRTVSRFLPLARRRERTARPLLVLIRFRKP